MRWFGSAAVAGASLVLSFLVIEIGLRVLGYPSHSLHSISQQRYAELAGMYEPGPLPGIIRVRGLVHDLNINSQGFRGAEPRRDADRPRVLFLGDSFTFGDSVNDDETLPEQVESALAGAIEALNGGVSGSTIVDQRVFGERMLALEPDLVVLVYSENDVSDLGAPVPLHARLAENRAMRSGWLATQVFHAIGDLAVFQRLLFARAAMATRSAPATRGESPGGEPAPSHAALTRYTEEVVAFRDFLTERGKHLIVALYPWVESLKGAGPKPSLSDVSAALKARGVEVVDLTPALARADLAPEQLYLLPWDAHPSPRGYAIAARALAPAVEAALAARSPAQPTER